MGASKANYTRQYLYNAGAYRLAGMELPYFYVSLAVEDAVRDLVRAQDVVLEPQRPIRFEELYQREVDENRVKGEILDYLARPHKLKFFNALTVVLLPVNPQTRLIQDKYGKDSAGAPAPDVDGMDVVDVGPVRLIKAPDQDAGFITWDKDRVRAVIIDGQHRFSAIKLAYDDDKFLWRDGLLATRLPVLLLVLDERAGFTPGKDENKYVSALATSREIFIDLNQHAEPVATARQHLLADRDLVAVAMRKLIEQRVPSADDGESDLSKRLGQDYRLPIAVVDWQSEQPKFDKGIYLTTTLTLYDLVEIALAAPAVVPSADYNEARVVLTGLALRLGQPDSVHDIVKSVDTAEEAEEPFTLSRPQIETIAEQFQLTRGRLVTRFLLELKPYRNLLDGYAAKQLLNGIYEQWAALDKSGRVPYLKWLAAEGHEVADPQETARSVAGAKGEYPLAFQVVFQKAAVAAACSMYDNRVEVGELIGREDLLDMHPDDFASFWVDRFNQRLVPQMKPRAAANFWDASAYNPNGNTQYTQVARNAITSAIIFGLVAPIGEWESTLQAEAWLKARWNVIKRGAKSKQLDRFLSHHGMIWRAAILTYERRRVKAAGQPEQDTTKAERGALRFGAERLYMLAAAGNGAAAAEAVGETE